MSNFYTKEGLYFMKDVVLNEMKKELSFRERIIVYIFKKTFIKICGIYGKNLVNQNFK